MQQTVHPPLTYDDLLATPDDGQRYEIIDGDLIVSGTPNRAHQWTASRLFHILHDATEDGRRGMVLFAPVDVRLSRFDIVQPDLLFIGTERLNIHTPDGLVEGPPDLVVEILSPSSFSRDLVRKKKLYAWSRVPEYWTVDPTCRTMRVQALDDGYYDPVPTDGGFARSLVFPDLRIDLARLFDGM